SEVHVVVFAEHRPAGSKHPFEAAADGPAEAIDAIAGSDAADAGGFGQEGSRNGADELMVLIGPGAAALDVGKNLRSEQVADATGRGDGVVDAVVRDERTDREARERRRDDMRAAEVAGVSHGLYANHPVAGELIIA